MEESWKSHFSAGLFLEEASPMLKKIFLCCCLLMTFLSAPLASAAPGITYDHQEFDPDTLTYRLSGHVAVKTGNRTITADRAEVSLLTNEVRAWGNISLVDGDITFRGTSTIVRHSDHSAEVEGPVIFEEGDADIRAQQGRFDWETKLATFTGDAVYVNHKTGDRVEKDTLTYNVKTKKIVQ